MPATIVAICGNIGVGKTTLCHALENECGVHVCYETAALNPYLADFYKDPQAHALAAQCRFLIDRVRSVIKAVKRHPAGIIVLDRVLYEDFLFASVSRRLGYIDDRDWRTYEKLYKTLVEVLPKPDILVYIKTDVDTLMSRIATRGRPEEENIQRDYISMLQQEYDIFAGQRFPCQLIKFDWTEPRSPLQILTSAIQTIEMNRR